MLIDGTNCTGSAAPADDMPATEPTTPAQDGSEGGEAPAGGAPAA